MKKKLISLFLIMAMLCTFVPIISVSAATIASGTCGDNLTWTLDSDGTLTISGTGYMTAFDFIGAEAPAPPWQTYKSSISSVVIEKGVTSIGMYAFYSYSINELSIPNSITSIGYDAFGYCTIMKIYYYGRKSEWDIIQMDHAGLSGRTILYINNVNGVGTYKCDTGDTVTINSNENTIYKITISLDNHNDYYTRISYGSSSRGHSGEDVIYIQPLSDENYTFTANFYTDFSYKTEITGTYTVTVEYLEDSGMCGDNAYYSITSDGILTISGSGAILSGSGAISGSWYGYHKYITSIIIDDGITSIGDYAFLECNSLESIEIPDSVTSIGASAFYGCNSIATVTGYTHSSAEMLAKYLGAEFISLGSDDYQEITVTNSKELLSAIGSYRKITMSPGTYEISTELNLRYMSDLEIVGGDRVEIISLDTISPVVNLQYADNITFDSVVMGHYTVETYGCGLKGYVIYASNCENLMVNNCDLFGCGLNGLALYNVTGLSADNTVIRDCMYNIMDLYDSDNIQLTNCIMKNNAYDESSRGYYKAINGENSSVKFVDCKFLDNMNYEFYDESKISVQFENCDFTRNIWQAAEVVATADAEVNNNTIAVYVDTENLNSNLNLFTASYDNTSTLDGYEKMENGSAEISAENVSVVKVFAWESLESMKPLCEAKSIEIEPTATPTFTPTSTPVVTNEPTITETPQTYSIEFERAAISNSDGDVVLTQADGDYLSHIVYTDSINNKTGNEIIVASVYGSDGQLSNEKTFNIKEYSENPDSYNGNETIIYIDKDVLPVNADSVIEISAYEDETRSAQLGSTYTYSAIVASNPTIYVAGDSTACTYSATGTNNVFPRTGWAAVLQNYFSGAAVKDLALSSRSSLDFLKEANYTTIKNNIKSGDYFIIQFGHYDSKSENAAKYTNPNGDRFTDGSYKNNIYVNYVQLALDRGAYPIITTSISRRRKSDSGLEAYVNTAKELGKELGLPVVDLYSKVNGYINEVGAEQAKDIYNYVYAKDPRFLNLTEGEFTKSQHYAAGTTDDTHINIYGAKMISQWFCDELERIQHPLTEKRNNFTMNISDIPSYASAM